MVRNMVKHYGNAIVPQIAEWIGRRIVQAVGESDHEQASK